MKKLNISIFSLDYWHIYKGAQTLLSWDHGVQQNNCHKKQHFQGKSLHSVGAPVLRTSYSKRVKFQNAIGFCPKTLLFIIYSLGARDPAGLVDFPNEPMIRPYFCVLLNVVHTSTYLIGPPQFSEPKKTSDWFWLYKVRQIIQIRLNVHKKTYIFMVFKYLCFITLTLIVLG